MTVPGTVVSLLCDGPLCPVWADFQHVLWRMSLLLSALLCLPGGVKVLRQPSCFSDYLSTSTCEWKMDGPTNCSAELHLSYLLDFSTPPNAE